MNAKTYSTIVATVFFVVAIAHITRIVFGWDVVFAGALIPMWMSYIGVIIAGGLSYLGYQTKVE